MRLKFSADYAMRRAISAVAIQVAFASELVRGLTVVPARDHPGG